MRLVLLIAALTALCGCATRNKVLFNKTTGPRWMSVDNPKEFLTDSELQFLGGGKASASSTKK